MKRTAARSVSLPAALAAAALLLLASSPMLGLSAATASPAWPSTDARPAALKALGLERCRFAHVRTHPGATPDALVVEVAFEDRSEPLILELEPYTLRTPDFRLVTVGDDGVEREAAPPPPSTYTGRDRATGAAAWASVADSRVAATIPGRDGAASIHIQSVARALPDTDPSLHAVYTDADATPHDARCGLDDCPHCQHAPTPAAPAPMTDRGPGCRVVELIADGDEPFFRACASAGVAAQEIEATLLGVNQLYAGTAGFTLPVRIALKKIVLRTSAATEPYAHIPAVNTDATALLVAAKNQWAGSGGGPRDLVHLFTGRDIAGTTAGLAYVGAFCPLDLPSRADIGFSECNRSWSMPFRASVAAHEIGHNFGMQHDAGGGFLMSPSADLTAPPTAFSALSVTAYNAAILSYTCLANATPDARPDGDRTLPGRPILIDVLANDNALTGYPCATPTTSFTLPASSTPAGAALALSMGTGPGGRNQILYTPPPGASGLEDSFSYLANGTTAIPVSVSVVSPAPAAAVSITGPGLAATFYDLREPNGSVIAYPFLPDFASRTPFGSGVATALNSPTGASAISGRTFGVGIVYEGYVEVPATDFYRFWTLSDDLSRVWIDGRSVAAAGSVGAASEGSGEIALAQGRHPIRVEYVQYSGASTLVLSYAGLGVGAAPAFTKAAISASAFVRGAPAPPCQADFNTSGAVNVADIFSFLSAWFAQTAGSDFNNDGFVNVADIFSFLAAWFAGC